MAKGDAKRYHHGELRTALLAAALDLLEREGPDALSLRALARSVGVSPMAPYHHFKDRKALMVAVATAGFDRLQKQKIQNEEAHKDVREALSAGAANYVRFILDNPNLYRLMKGSEFADWGSYSELHDAAAAPARILMQMIGQLFREYSVSERLVAQRAQMLWGLAHGIGTLALDGRLPRHSAPLLAHQAAVAMVEGWLKLGKPVSLSN